MTRWKNAKAGKTKLGIRLLALLLAVGVLCSLHPASVYAAEATGNTEGTTDTQQTESTPATTETTEQMVQTVAWKNQDVLGGMEPTLNAPSVEQYAAASKSTPAEKNLYALTVATGVKPGDSVHYFVIRYLDDNKVARTKYLFPHDDAYALSYEYMNKNGGSNEALNKRHELIKSLGYKVNSPSNPTALAPWSVDEYLFDAPTGLSSITGVEVFMSTGSWAVQGMYVSRVTSIGGYGEYGYVSGKYFFGLGKEKIAELTKKKSGTLTLSANGDTLINVGGSNSQYFDLTAVSENATATESPFADLYSLRLDFADDAAAGIEGYIRTASNNLNLVSQDFTEDLAIRIEYKDTNGWTRNVSMPVVMSAIAQSLEFGDQLKTYGLCQRGDTIAFTACLPEFASLVDAKLYVGSSARSEIANSGGITYTSSTQAKRDAESRLKGDTIGISSFSIYKGTCRMSNIENGTDQVSGESLQGLTTVYSFSESAPMLYATTTNSKGIRVNDGGNNSFKLTAYSTANPLIGASNDKHILVRLHTDTMGHAATTSEVFVRLSYGKSDGSMTKTQNYNVKSEIQDFMGYWPSASGITGAYAYEYGMRADGIAEFPVDLQDISGISNVEVSLGSGGDDWQMSGFSIAYVPSIGPRRVYLQNTSAGNDSSIFRMVRSMERTDIPPFPLGITRHFDENETDSWDVTSGNSTGSTDGVDYESMRYSMTYEQAQMNLGFVNSRKKYDVTVKVADDDSTSNGNGDSGSANHFYFQLMFKNGNSAVVLANQQLSADGFRAGYNESFTVITNRDYGNLTGVRIIPEDLSEDSDVFDKLNIDRITVTEQTNGGAAMQYVLDSVGWVGIDYHDKSEDGSIRGRQGRTMSELASRYNVSYQRHVVNLLCEVMTLPWEMEDYLQVQGSICCDLTYVDTNGQPQTISFDVVNRMAQYMNRSAITFESPVNDEVAATKYYKNMTAVSDPDWMLRPNHTDRFILPSIPNLQSLKSITFYATSRNNKPGQWVIGGINISQILEDGTVRLTADNEYYRDLKTQPLCRMVAENDKVSMLLPAGAMQSMTVQLTDNQLVWSEDSSWVSPVTRIPESEDDTVNVYLYPTEEARDIGNEKVNMAVQYTKSFESPQQAIGVLAGENSGTADARFVLSGVRVPGLMNINSLTLHCTNSRIVFDHAVIQHIREGVIVSNYYVPFNKATALLGLTAKPVAYVTMEDPRDQMVYLSLGMETKATTLFETENDIAVSFKYRSLLDNGQTEYYSPYVYFTDAGINKIYPGLMAEIPFHIPYVSEITGYRIAAFGNVEATVEGALIANYSYSSKTTDETTGETVTNDLVREGVYSIADFSDGGNLVQMKLTNTIQEKAVSAAGMNGYHTVAPLDIIFTTSDALSTGESGTNAAVQMVFNYMDYNGGMRSRTILDAKNYIQGSNRFFQTGTESRMSLFLPECRELISISVLPYDDSGMANWSVSSINGTLALGDGRFNRTVNSLFTQSAAGIIYLKEVAMNTYVSVDGQAATAVANHTKSMVLNSGQVVKTTVTTMDGNGFNVTANWVVNDTYNDVTASTITNRTSAGFDFVVPENTSSTPQTYALEITSAANPTVKDVINITVQGVAPTVVVQPTP